MHPRLRGAAGAIGITLTNPAAIGSKRGSLPASWADSPGWRIPARACRRSRAPFHASVGRCCPHEDTRGAVAAMPVEQTFAPQPGAVVRAEPRHQYPAPLGQVARRRAEVGPRLGRILIQPLHRPGRRSHAVSADDHDVHETRRRALGEDARGQRQAGRQRDEGPQQRTVTCRRDTALRTPPSAGRTRAAARTAGYRRTVHRPRC